MSMESVAALRVQRPQIAQELEQLRKSEAISVDVYNEAVDCLLTDLARLVVDKAEYTLDNGVLLYFADNPYGFISLEITRNLHHIRRTYV